MYDTLASAPKNFACIQSFAHGSRPNPVQLLKGIGISASLILALALFPQAGLAAENFQLIRKEPVPMTLANLIGQVLERNEMLQAKLLDFEQNRQKYLAEKGIFDPELVGSVSEEVNNRPNTAEQENITQTTIYQETNNIYDFGLESLINTGARVHLGYNLTDIKNNINPNSFAIFSVNTNSGQLQYQSFLGLTVTQPLLKNFGPAVTMAGIRVAALSSKIAYQDYRKQLMTVVSTTEATYWNLYLAQEQVRFFEDSVKNAGNILKDNRTRQEAGKGSELEVLESQAGLGARQAKLLEAQQRVVEAANRVLSLYGRRTDGGDVAVRAVDAPAVREEFLEMQESERTATELNPDFRIQREKVEQELIRLGYARNQRLPELNLKGAYGVNGLGPTPGDSFDNLERNDFPSYSFGLEFRVPLGGIKGRHELSAAELQLESAQRSLSAIQTEIFNGLDSARHKLISLRNTVDSYRSAVTYNQSLFDSALTRLDAGKLESRKVLEVESDLFEARNSVVESLVRYEIARLEVQVMEGNLLQQRKLEISQEELQKKTRNYMHHGKTGPQTVAYKPASTNSAPSTP